MVRCIYKLEGGGNDANACKYFPAALLKQAGFAAGEGVALSFNGKEIVMRKMEETKSDRLARRFEGFQGEMKCTEFGFDSDDVGL